MAKRNMPVRNEPPDELVDAVEDAIKKNQPLKLVIANCKKVNIRKEPTKNSKVLFEIPVGTIIFADNFDDGWFHVRVSDKDGYVLAEYTKEG
jgi:hypothetical protein